MRVRLPRATLLRPQGRLHFRVHQLIIIDLCFYYTPVVQRQLGGAVYKPSHRNSVLFLRIASNNRNCQRRIKHQDHSRGCREGSRWKPYPAIVKEIVLRTVTRLRSIAKMPSEYTAWVCSRGTQSLSQERPPIIGKLEINIWGFPPVKKIRFATHLLHWSVEHF